MRWFFLTMFLLLSSAPVVWGVTTERGPAEAVRMENNPRLVERYRIQIVNDTDGPISVGVNNGKTWKQVGKVLYPTYQVNEKGYTASRWVDAGEVAATAVNAIHLQAGYSAKEEKGMIFSLLPKEQLQPPVYYNSYLSQDASIYTNIPAGTWIFGGAWSPFVGNEVLVRRGGQTRRMPSGYVPQVKDVITIVVTRPEPYPEALVFENRFGGKITLQYPLEDPKVIGEVLKPVFGVGRFQGTAFAAPGRIRANHAGVIDISTSRLTKTGGFQIIPANHGMSPEMGSARFLTQWMVVGPPRVTDDSYEGVAPLFRYFLHPRYDPEDLSKEDWIQRVADRFMVQIKRGGEGMAGFAGGIEAEGWEPMPVLELDPDLRKPLASWAGTALKDVTHFRILFPITPKEILE